MENSKSKQKYCFIITFKQMIHPLTIRHEFPHVLVGVRCFPYGVNKKSCLTNVTAVPILNNGPTTIGIQIKLIKWFTLQNCVHDPVLLLPVLFARLVCCTFWDCSRCGTQTYAFHYTFGHISTMYMSRCLRIYSSLFHFQFLQSY